MPLHVPSLPDPPATPGVEPVPVREERPRPSPAADIDRRVTTRRFLVDLARLGGMQLALAVAGLLRYKVLALRLGAEGLGGFQQLVTTAGTATVIVAFGLAFALNRNIATARDADHRQRLLATSNFIVLSLTVLVLIACVTVLVTDPQVVRRLGVEATPVVVATLAILLLGVPLEALKNNQVSFLMASLDVRGMTSGRSIAVLVATVCSIPLVWAFGPLGAALQLVAINLLLVGVLGYRCARLGYAPFRIRADRSAAGALAAFGAAALAVGFVQQGGDLVVRTHLVRQYGIAQNGYYQSALLLAGQVQTIVLSGIGGYALASLGNETGRAHAIASSNLLLRSVLPVATLAFAAVGILAYPLLILLYAPTFVTAVQFVPLMLATLLLEAVTWVIGAPMLALRGVRMWLGLNLAHFTLRVLAAVALLPVVGPTGVVVGYFAAMCVHVALHTYVFIRVLGLEIDRSHYHQLAIGLALIVGTAWSGVVGASPAWPHYALGVSLYLAYAAYVVHRYVGLGRARRILARMRPEAAR